MGRRVDSSLRRNAPAAPCRAAASTTMGLTKPSSNTSGGWQAPQHHTQLTRLAVPPHQQHKASYRQQRVKAFKEFFHPSVPASGCACYLQTCGWNAHPRTVANVLSNKSTPSCSPVISWLVGHQLKITLLKRRRYVATTGSSGGMCPSATLGLGASMMSRMAM